MQTKTIKLAHKQLIGTWHYGKSRRQLIVICHGFRASRDDPTLVAITRGLNKSGYDTFTFNFSQNTGGFDIEHQVQDLRQITEYFQRYKELILLAGSFAALTAAIATVQIPRVTGLITLNGFFGEGALGQEHRRNYVKFRVAAFVIPKYRKILKYFRQELRPELIRVPALVIHSIADKYVFIDQSRKFYDQLRSPKQFTELKTANHGVTSAVDRQEVISEITSWLATTKK